MMMRIGSKTRHPSRKTFKLASNLVNDFQGSDASESNFHVNLTMARISIYVFGVCVFILNIVCIKRSYTESKRISKGETQMRFIQKIN
jgi:hypothetical protein